KNYQEAYEEAKWVIDNKDRFGYQLMDDFQDLYFAKQQNGLKEHIFAVDFLGNTNSGDYNTDWLAATNGPRGFWSENAEEGWSVSVPSLKVFQTWDERDYRREVSFIDSAYMGNPDNGGEWVGWDKFAPNHGSSRPHIAKFFLHCGDSRGDCGYSDVNYVAM